MEISHDPLDSVKEFRLFGHRKSVGKVEIFSICGTRVTPLVYVARIYDEHYAYSKSFCKEPGVGVGFRSHIRVATYTYTGTCSRRHSLLGSSARYRRDRIRRQMYSAQNEENKREFLTRPRLRYNQLYPYRMRM